MVKKNTAPSGKAWVRICFLVYCAGMLWLLFGQRMGEDTGSSELQQLGLNINLVPLRTLRQYLALLGSSNGYYVRHAAVNLLGNVVLFIPLGIFLPWIWEKLRSFFRVALLITAVIALVEALQYYTHLGSCDIDDWILNFLGAAIGYCLFRLKTAHGRKGGTKSP